MKLRENKTRPETWNGPRQPETPDFPVSFLVALSILHFAVLTVFFKLTDGPAYPVPPVWSLVVTSFVNYPAG